MKKLSLLFVACAFIVCAVAQKPAVNPNPKKANQLVRKITATEHASSMFLPKPLGSNSKHMSTVLVGHSANAYSSIIPQCHQVCYEPVTGLISYIHCGGPTNGTGNQIFCTISANKGATWDTTTVVYNPNTGVYFGRYPSGALFNPTGNTDPNNVYLIVAGPATNGSEWVGTYVGWKKKSGVAKNQVLVHNNQNRVDCNHFTILPNGKFFMGGYAHLDNDTNYTQMNYTLFSGKLDVANDTVIDLNTTIIVPPFFKHGTDTVGEANYSAAVAFNKAGTVGYYVFIGIRGDVADPMSNPSYRPIVYKTTDEGASWNILPDYDFAVIPSFNQILPGTSADPTEFHPFFGEIQDLVVDANDNLHIASYVRGHASTNIDSLDFTFIYDDNNGFFYDTHITSGGFWDATIIDVQNTKDHIASDTNDLDLENRLQMGLSTDGKKIFYTWADSDSAQGATENVLPDLYVKGRNIDSAHVSGFKMNMTAGTAFEYGATNHCMAPIVEENSPNFTIFNVITQLGARPAIDPVNYYIIADIPLKINNLDKYVANISNLYPNPTNGLTNVDLSLIKSTDVSIQVVNMMGQVVSSQDCGHKTTGMHKLTINANDLTSGIYFVTIKAGNSTSISKMIVK